MAYRMFPPVLTTVIALGFSMGSAAFTPATTEIDGRHVPRIDWDTTLNKFQIDKDTFIGQRFTAVCPPAPAAEAPEQVDAGTAFDSTYAMCQAALQTGAIDSGGGVVTVQLNPTGPVYGGSAGASARRTMSVIGQGDHAAADQIYREHVKRLDWDSKFTRVGFANPQFIGQRFSFDCPAAPSNLSARRVVGTDYYAFDSIICRAAVHAGAVTLSGGMVTVQMNPGNMSLSGSIRHDIESSSGSSGRGALSFVDNPVSP